MAIKGMCVRAGRKGRMKGLGSRGTMWMVVNPFQIEPMGPDITDG